MQHAYPLTNWRLTFFSPEASNSMPHHYLYNIYDVNIVNTAIIYERLLSFYRVRRYYNNMIYRAILLPHQQYITLIDIRNNPMNDYIYEN